MCLIDCCGWGRPLTIAACNSQYAARILLLFRILIDGKAPNTDLLQGKELRFFMMAGSWPDATDEQPAVRELMLQHHIQAVMLDGNGYGIELGLQPADI